MADEGTGWSRRPFCLAFLVFLFVYLPLDAFDFDASDTFDEGIVQVRVQAGEDALNSQLHPAVIFLGVPCAVAELHGIAPISKPICRLPISRNSCSLPRSDDPHVTSPHSVEFPAHISAV